MAGDQWSESEALEMDARDPLRSFRDEFFMPKGSDGRPLVYFCGNSLGLQPKRAKDIVSAELDAWATQGVEGHFKPDGPWYTYHELVREPLARLVGARPHEVVAMNGLTVNLHLMLTSFFRPDRQRRCMLIEQPAFPSDLYALQSHLNTRELDPASSLLTWNARQGDQLLYLDDLDAMLDQHGESIAVMVVAGVNFLTGQCIDVPALVERAHRRGIVVGLDLAHAVGNVPLRLHDWGVDFAVWCSYKYLNSGPGAVAGCFVHEKFAHDVQRPRFGGWWGNDPTSRFRMQLESQFVPVPSADGWQLSNPPIFSLAPLRASLEMFDRAAESARMEKSRALTGRLRTSLEALESNRFTIITPHEGRGIGNYGCQLSLLVHDRPRELFKALEEAGVIGDFREPNVIRLSPVPLYNSFHDVWRCVQTLKRLLAATA